MEETVLWQLAQEKGLLPFPAFRRAYQVESKKLGYRRMYLSEKTWRRWLRGDVQTAPFPQGREVLEHIFKRPVAELFAKVSSTNSGVAVPDMAPLRPAVLLGAAVEPRGMYEMMMDAASESRQAAAEAELELGPAALEQVGDDVIHLARTYLLQPPAATFPKLVKMREKVRGMQEETRRPDQLAELSRLESMASMLMAEACIDLGQTRHATDHARAAWAAAQRIDHVPLAVWARGMMATSAYWSGQPRDSVNVIIKAEQHRPEGIAAARVHSIAARAWSHLGNTDKVVESIRAAMDARASAREEDELQTIGGVFDWDVVREQRCFSSALLQLLQVRRGEFEPAAVHDFVGRILDYTRAALADARALPTEERSAMVEATIGIEAATAFVLLEDLINARQMMDAVLELPEQMRTFPVVYRLKALHEQLCLAQQTQHARALDSDVLAFMQVPAVRELTSGN